MFAGCHETGRCSDSAGGRLPQLISLLAKVCGGSSTAVGSWLRFPLSNKAFSWPPGWNKQTPPSRRRGGKSWVWNCLRSAPGHCRASLCCRRVRGTWVGAHGAPLGHCPACWDIPLRQRPFPVNCSELVGLSSSQKSPQLLSPLSFLQHRSEIP